MPAASNGTAANPPGTALRTTKVRAPGVTACRTGAIASRVRRVEALASISRQITFRLFGSVISTACPWIVIKMLETNLEPGESAR